MALIHSNFNGMYAGVSKQIVDLRLENHCEELINCYPSIQYGLQRRNPTELINSPITTEDNQFMYQYDRGLAGETNEQYVITVDGINNLRVYDVVANEYRSVNYSGAAQAYLVNSNHRLGFSALTIKDTTYLVNREKRVQMLFGGASVTANTATLNFDSIGYVENCRVKYGITKAKTFTAVYNTLAPARIRRMTSNHLLYDNLIISAVGATFTITVDGVDVKYTVNTKDDGYSLRPESLSEMRTNLSNHLAATLGENYYVGVSGSGIVISELTGEEITVTTSLEYPTSVELTAPAEGKYGSWHWQLDNEENMGVNPITAVYSTNTQAQKETIVYDKTAYVWIKRVSPDPSFPYTFTLTLKDADGSSISTTTSSATTSNGVASALATWVNSQTGFSAGSEGSVLKIERETDDFMISISDTYGDEASIAWKGAVTSMSDLPKNFPFPDTLVQVSGVDKTDSISYWVKYDGSRWVESRAQGIKHRFDVNTMPHKITRNADLTFTLSPVEWDEMLVGDGTPETYPNFVDNTISDLFFVNGRLGFISPNGVNLSQVNRFTNFFRTTMLDLLDDTPVIAFVEHAKVAGLKFAVELQNKVILFGDKVQFALDASKAITPKNILVEPISSFEIYSNIRPINIGDNIMFLVSKGSFATMMEMNIESLSSSVKANDISSHVAGYIDKDISAMIHSTQDNCVFLLSETNKGTIFIYKYLSLNGQSQQSSWGKWDFSSEIKSIFIFNGYLYLISDRYDVNYPIEDLSLYANWDDSQVWHDDQEWIDNDLVTYATFEKMRIEPHDVTEPFLDNGGIQYNSAIQLSKWFIADREKEKDLRGTLLLKTIQVSSTPDSAFNLEFYDSERDKTRIVPSSLVVNRKPFIGGSSKNTDITVTSSNGNGFIIKSISLEGQYNVRSKKV